MEKDNNLIVNMGDGKEEKSDVLDAAALSSHHSHHSHHHHSSHHHSHHHSHSGKSRRRKSNKEKTKKFFKRNKYKIGNAIVAVLFVAILVGLGFALDNRSASGNGGNTPVTNDSFQITGSSVIVEVPMFEDEVVIVNEAVEEYMNSDSAVLASNIRKKYPSVANPDSGLPVKLWYNIKGLPEGYAVISAELFVSEKSNFDSPIVYSLSGDVTSVDVYNLKTGTQYYFRFVLSVSNGTKTSVDGSFRTAEGPRMLNIDGVSNARDFGGWKTLDGKRIRQGILYRSSELDGAIDSKYTITPDGVNTMLTVLGIKSDFDLRYEGDNLSGTDALGASVAHNYYAAPLYSEVFSDNGKQAMKNVFSDLAENGSNPVLIHCTHGMDRTGTVIYLLGAVLGMSEEDLMREYQLSAFCHGEMWGMNQMNEFIGMLKSYEGVTIQKKAENYLLSVGVTPEEIAAIRATYLEEI